HLRKSDRVGSKGKNQDRSVRWVDLSIRRISRQIRWQLTARCVDRSLNVTPSRINIAVQIKLQDDPCGTCLTRRSHLSYAGNPPELALERRSDCRGHGFRACSRQ